MPHHPAKKFYVLLPFACDYIEEKKSIFELANSPTIIRLKAGIEKLSELDPGFEHSLLVLSAGFTKNDPLTPGTSGQKQSLACQVRDYVAPRWPNLKISAETLGYGTEAELENGIYLAQEYMFGKHGPEDYEEVILITSSNSMHHFGMFPVFSMYFPSDWDCIKVVANHPFSLWDKFREVARFIVGAWRCFIAPRK